MTVRSVTKENLELVTKTKILDEDNRNYKEQLRVVNEKYAPLFLKHKALMPRIQRPGGHAI